jgi:hypothetical protein
VLPTVYTWYVPEYYLLNSDKWSYNEQDPYQLFGEAGVPLSMLLFAMCIDPLIQTLAEILQPIVFGRSGNHPAILAYTDDITIILQSPGDILKIQETLKKIIPFYLMIFSSKCSDLC